MATFHSSLYGTPPNANADTAPIYKGPSGPVHSGEVQIITGTFTNVAASPFGGSSGDALKLCKLPQGAKLGRFVAVPSGDLDSGNSFAFNLGNTDVANAYASAATGLQSASAYALALEANAAVAAVGADNELILARTAGSLATAGTITFAAEIYQP